MNMFARFDKNPAMTLQDIRKQNVTDGRTGGRTQGRTDNVKTVYPPQTKFAGGIIIDSSKQSYFFINPKKPSKVTLTFIWVN